MVIIFSLKCTHRHTNHHPKAFRILVQGSQTNSHINVKQIFALHLKADKWPVNMQADCQTHQGEGYGSTFKTPKASPGGLANPSVWMRNCLNPWKDDYRKSIKISIQHHILSSVGSINSFLTTVNCASDCKCQPSERPNFPPVLQMQPTLGFIMFNIILLFLITANAYNARKR